MVDKEEFNNLANLFFEVNLLTRLKRTGSLLVNDSEEVKTSDHIFRTIFIGYILSGIENADSSKVMRLCLLKNLPKSRVLELNKVALHYIDGAKALDSALKDQLNLFPSELRKDVLSCYEEHKDGRTKEAIICKDANYLSEAIVTKEAIERGVDMKDWKENLKKALKLENSLKIFDKIMNGNSIDWWKELKYIPEIERGKQKD